MTWQGQPRGEDNRRSKLTENNVREIRHRISMGHRQIDIAADYRVSPMTICHIANGTRWAWLS